MGSHTCVALLAAGHDVVVVDDFSNSDVGVLRTIMDVAGKRLTWIEADIRNRELIGSVMARDRYDAVLHFAALKSAPESIERPEQYWDVNVGGTAVLLTAALAARVDRFVFSSSAIIYGAQEAVPIPETTQPAPLNPYARTKLAGEQMLRDAVGARPNFRVCILRYFNPVGAHASGRIGEKPRQRATNLFPIVLSALRNRTTIDIFGTDYETPDGSAIRDFIHVMDIADGHAAAVEFLAGDSSAGHADAWTFNLSTGKGCSVLELIAKMEKVGGRAVSARASTRRSGDIAISVGDSSRAATVLGWRARRTLEDACRDSLRWLDNASAMPL